MSGKMTVVVESAKGRQMMNLETGGSCLSALLRRQGLPLNTRCGERRLCDGCMVELVQGRLKGAEGVVEVGSGEEAKMVRACECTVMENEGELQIRIPQRSLLAHEAQVLSEFKVNVPFAQDPLVGSGRVGGASEDKSGRDKWGGGVEVGVAVDIGTTTVAVLLIDLATGEIVSRASGFNRQMHLGDDVVTRINLCQTDATMLGQLQKEVVEHTIVPLVTQGLRDWRHRGAAGGGDMGRVRISGFTMAGNTTMLHILAGVDPSSMGMAPFTPAFLEHRVLKAGEIGLRLPNVEVADDVEVHLLPGAAAYVGADLVAGMLSSGLAYDEGPSLLVDVGTNGEILFKYGDRIWGCATAAGPAFEGARLHSGIRAGRGAICSIRLESEPFGVKYEVIGEGRPIGICGSAYIDFLAEGRRVGLLNEAGRFDVDAVPECIGQMVMEDCHASGLRVAPGRSQQSILISEVDISSLLQAKAAIAAGILTLLDQVQIQPREIKRLYLAGGFGTHMNHRNAIACGLLPGFSAEQVQVVGNSSLAGAWLAMMDRGALQEMSRLASRVEMIELNMIPGFEDRFIDQLMLI